MTMYTTPTNLTAEDTMPRELRALVVLEATPNGIRLRIASLAPDQLYRGTTEELSIAETIALAVERERVYGPGFAQAQADYTPTLIEPQPTPLFIDRDFHDDLATFFDLRRETLDVLRALPVEQWDTQVSIPEVGNLVLRDLAVRLADHDRQMIESINRQRRYFLRTTGVSELRDSGTAGKLAPNIGQ